MREIHPRHHRRHQGRRQHAQQALQRQHIARQGGGVAQVDLQPQRQQHDGSEEGAEGQGHRQGGDGEAAMTEQAQIDHRIAVGHIPR